MTLIKNIIVIKGKREYIFVCASLEKV